MNFKLLVIVFIFPIFISFNFTSVSTQEASICELYVPNIFAPKVGDGNNTIFKPQGVDCVITEYQLQIYNRWGRLLFESESIDNGWDGKFEEEIQDQGTYIYVISYATEDMLEGANKEVLTGGVTLLR